VKETAAALRPLTEISQFEFSLLIDEQVLGLQVPVENFPLMTIRQPSQNLVQEDLEGRVETWDVKPFGGSLQGLRCTESCGSGSMRNTYIDYW